MAANSMRSSSTFKENSFESSCEESSEMSKTNTVDMPYIQIHRQHLRNEGGKQNVEARVRSHRQKHVDMSEWEISLILKGLPSIHDMMTLCCELTGNEEIIKSGKYSRNCGVAVGILVAAGGLLGGPPGIAVGGTVGGLLGWLWTKGKFKSVPQIITEMTRDQQRELYKKVMVNLKSKLTDPQQLMSLVRNNPKLREQVTDVVLNFIKNNC